jgi:hypothetical protein
MAVQFFVYSNRSEDIREIQRIFSQLPDADVELVWVEESRLMGPRIDVPFVSRETDGKRFRGLDVMQWFVDQVNQGHQSLTSA